MYDDCAAMPVDIIGLDYDFWHEIGKADDKLEPGEEPGPFLLRDCCITPDSNTPLPTWVESVGRRTIDAAMKDAAAKVPGEILRTQE